MLTSAIAQIICDLDASTWRAILTASSCLLAKKALALVPALV